MQAFDVELLRRQLLASIAAGLAGYGPAVAELRYLAARDRRAGPLRRVAAPTTAAAVLKRRISAPWTRTHRQLQARRAGSRTSSQPVWTTVVGGPADESDPGKWLFAAYTEVMDMTTDAARRLEERTASSTSPLRRVEALGEAEGYRQYRNRSGHLFIVRSDGPPHLAAYFNTRLPVGFTEEQVFSDLVRLAEFARRV